MADNTTLNPGTGGDVIASDEIGGVKYQRVKLASGPDGVAIDVSDDAPLPVYDSESRGFLYRILQMLMSPLGYDKSLQRQRGTVVLEASAATIGAVNIAAAQTLATVGTVSNISTIDAMQGRLLVTGQNLAAWQACVRSRIT